MQKLRKAKQAEPKKEYRWSTCILSKILSVFSVFVVPFLAMWLLQWFTCDPWRMYPKMIVLNSVFFYLFYLGLSFALGSFRKGYGIGVLLTLLLGIVNYFVVEFRSSPIVPWDLMSLGTAVSVADNYTYTLSARFVWIVLGFVVLLLLSAGNVLQMKKKMVRWSGSILCLAMLLGTGTAVQKEEVQDWLGMDQTLFTPNVLYRNNGFMAAFVANLRFIHIEEPSGYSTEKVQALTSETETEKEFDLSQAPNIIVIMDEAFSDLQALGEFHTDQEYMPFMRQLMEEFTSGQLMVSVKGGNTANTEYEFLSGDTMAFLPAGSVVYQQYVKQEEPSLASNLKSLGYSATALHPYHGKGWDRNTVYPRLGFDTFLDLDFFEDAEYLRSYVSDQSAFDKIIELYEAKAEGEKQFIFEVTMQNHGGYSKEYPGFEAELQLTDFTSTSTSIQAAEKYLTLIKKTDEALQKLVEYFEEQEEPTVIVFFGDHQPSDYITNVISRITGYDGERSLEEHQQAYLIPYVIWNNYGLEKDTSKELISVNYLSAYLMELLDLPMSRYQKFLMELSDEIPVVCAGAYVDKNGNYHSYEEKDPVYAELLNDYHILQYNHLTDRSNRVEEVFSVADAFS